MDSVMDEVEIGGIKFEPQWLDEGDYITIWIKSSDPDNDEIHRRSDRGMVHANVPIRLWERFQREVRDALRAGRRMETH